MKKKTTEKETKETVEEAPETITEESTEEAVEEYVDPSQVGWEIIVIQDKTEEQIGLYNLVSDAGNCITFAEGLNGFG